MLVGVLGFGVGAAAERVVKTREVLVSNEVPVVVTERLKQVGLEQWTDLYATAEHFRVSMGVTHPFLSEMTRTMIAAGIGDFESDAYPLYPIMRGEWGARPMTADDVDDQLGQTHTEADGLLAQQAEVPIRELISKAAHALPLLSLGYKQRLLFGDNLQEMCGKYADACTLGDTLHLGRITSKTRAAALLDNIVHEANHPLMDDLLGPELTADVASRIDPARLTEYAAEMYGITEGFYRAFADAPYEPAERRFGIYSVRGERMGAVTGGVLEQAAGALGESLDPVMQKDLSQAQPDETDLLLKQQDEYLRIVHKALRVQFGLEELPSHADPQQAKDAIGGLIKHEISGFFHWLHSPVAPDLQGMSSLFSTEAALQMAQLEHQRAMIAFYSNGTADSYASLAEVIDMKDSMNTVLVSGELATEPEAIEAASKQLLSKFGFTERGVHVVLLDSKTARLSNMHVYDMPAAPAHPDKSHTLLDVFIDGSVTSQYFVQGPVGMTVNEVRNANPDYIEVVCTMPGTDEETILYLNREYDSTNDSDDIGRITAHRNETSRFEFPPSKMPEGVFATSVRLSDMDAYSDAQRTLRRATTSISVGSGIETPKAEDTRAFAEDLVLADNLYVSDSYAVGRPNLRGTWSYNALGVLSEEGGVAIMISNAFSEEDTGADARAHEMYFSSGLLCGLSRFRDPQMAVSEALDRMGLELVGAPDDVARLSGLRLEILRGGLQVSHDSVGSTELVVTNLTYTPPGIGLEPPDLSQYARAEVRKKSV